MDVITCENLTKRFGPAIAVNGLDLAVAGRPISPRCPDGEPANGQVIATSETYERKESALNGIESVKTNAPGAVTDDQAGD